MKSSTPLFATIFLLLASSASACSNSTHHSAPPPANGGSNCMSAVMNNMMSCMDYVMEGQSEKKPDKACCNGTKTVIKEEGAKCLCQAFAAAPQYGFKFDAKKANKLPELCQISGHHYLSKCLGVAEVPAMAPSPKPESHKHHMKKKKTSAPAPAPETGSSSAASVSYGLMAVVALLPLAFSV